MPTTYVQDVYPSNATYTFENNTWTYNSGTAQFPVYVPVDPQRVWEQNTPKIDDSPLAWLRREVDEMCELARAA